ncbi:Excalibur domain protein [Mesorhizobium plurifarium]|uniref:Excalibur domain protein n=1 Tax=Mesorhizobium plurifarium TaxID=69974 RepID=A0A090DF09_MESPL|nr:Excalibur domain protein [Mesorhizobium plurifarium]CDX51881.1 Excalibur domain protein [Mesorhizobium plurifarium]
MAKRGAAGIAWLIVLAAVAWHGPAKHKPPPVPTPKVEPAQRTEQPIMAHLEQKAVEPQTAASPVGKPPPLEGPAKAVDGDTIEISGKPVHIHGIDAPEFNQQCDDAKNFTYSCGWEITTAFQKFLKSAKIVRCEFVSWDQYGRYVGSCTTRKGLDLASWLVSSGLAPDWPQYSGGAYADLQSKAQKAKRGIWSGTFEIPSLWREKEQARIQQKQQFSAFTSQAQIAGYSCQPRRYCKQIRSCAEANWYMQNCSWGGALDRDNDGIPCEGTC